MSQTHRLGTVATAFSRGADDVLRVTYHTTDVVTVYPNGRIDLDHGGWRTVTTKLRMNQASNQFRLGFLVWQKDFEWFVDIDGQTIPFNTSPLTVRLGSDFLREKGNPPLICISRAD